MCCVLAWHADDSSTHKKTWNCYRTNQQKANDERPCIVRTTMPMDGWPWLCLTIRRDFGREAEKRERHELVRRQGWWPVKKGNPDGKEKRSFPYRTVVRAYAAIIKAITVQLKIDKVLSVETERIETFWWWSTEPIIFWTGTSFSVAWLSCGWHTVVTLSSNESRRY